MSWTSEEEKRIGRLENEVDDLVSHALPRLEQMVWDNSETLGEIKDAFTGGLKTDDDGGWFQQIRLNSNFRRNITKLYYTVLGSTLVTAILAGLVLFKSSILELIRKGLHDG